jgi:hypothetical protein
MRGVEAYRAGGQPWGSLELQIVSAGHGVVPAHRRLSAYNATFSGMRAAQLVRYATRLGIPGDVSALLRPRRRLAVVLLGDHYLRAAALSERLQLGAPTLVFASPAATSRLPPVRGLYPIPLDNRDAQRLSCGLIGLKGELVARLLEGLVGRPNTDLPFDRSALLTWLEGVPSRVSVQSAQQHLARAA